MQSIVFARHIERDYNFDVADQMMNSDDLRQTYMYSYGTGRKLIRHGFSDVLTRWP